MFSRYSLTRILCVLAALQWVWLVLITAWFGVLCTNRFDELLRWLFVGAVGAFLIGWPAIATLWLWRRCRSCTGRLFSNVASSPSMSPWGRPDPWMGKLTSPFIAKERHFRARAFLGSFRDRAIVDYIRNGSTRCQWCNHEDGVPENYVVAPGD